MRHFGFFFGSMFEKLKNSLPFCKEKFVKNFLEKFHFVSLYRSNSNLHVNRLSLLFSTKIIVHQFLLDCLIIFTKLFILWMQFIHYEGIGWIFAWDFQNFYKTLRIMQLFAGFVCLILQLLS